MSVKVGVVLFPGTNCEQDIAWAVERLGAEATVCWHGDPTVGDADAVVIPGGFAHGDYLRTGAIARFSPVMDAVREFAAAFLDRYDRLDVLIDNAGLVLGSRSVTEDGYETTFQVNHLGHFLLTDLLRDRLEASAPSRVVVVSSDAHKNARHGLDFDDLQSERKYKSFGVYGKTKLANILFTRELARRLGAGPPIANVLHPGFVASRFGSDNGPLWRLVFRTAQRIAAISSEQAAEGLLHLALAPALATTTGAYFDRTVPATPSPAALDDRSAHRLWSASADLARIDG